ncbi:MAG: hypothetical protein WCX23_01635 [Candidatus Paceibacterota bacterium]|jgi:hypothetical protein
MEKYNFYIFGTICLTPLLAAVAVPETRITGFCNFFTGICKLIKERP